MDNEKLNISDLMKDTLQDKVMGIFGKSGSGKSTAIKKILNSNVINKNKKLVYISPVATPNDLYDFKYKANNVDDIMKYFDNKCSDCGFRGQMCQFDFDHIDPLTKKFTLGLNGLPHINPEDILNEVSKVQMLCANCHRKHSTRYEKQNMDNQYKGTASVTLTKMAEPIPDRERLRRDSP